MNSALLFIKPHANNAAVQALVSEKLIAAGLLISSDGEITAEEIEKGMLIDNHYYSIASKATILQPFDLNVPADKFQEKFGIAWEAALAEGNVYNALDATKFLEITAEELEIHWRKIPTELLIKFGGGFYCGKLIIENKPTIYVFNAFFMSMRQQFVTPGTSIHYYVVEWDPNVSGISWKDFRANILGATDPTQAPENSLRGSILKDWESLGLTAVPSTGLNGVHGSASPIEGLAEKSNWLKLSIAEDDFGSRLLSAGISQDMIESWFKDPQVVEIGSVFDFMEDKNSDECITKALEILQKQEGGGDGSESAAAVAVAVAVAEEGEGAAAAPAAVEEAGESS